MLGYLFAIFRFILMRNWNLIFGIAIISSPILFSMIAFPDSITWSWNEGRGGYLFALIFVVAELVGLRIVISKKRLLAVIPMALLVIGYLISLEYGFRDYIIAYGESIDIPLIFSFTWMWDFIVMAIFILIALTVFFGKRWIRIAPAAPIFLTGTAIILSLDAFFPYDTLGPLQYVVPYFIQANVWIITTLELGTAVARDNVMFLRGDHGSIALQVFWPSAGVHSIIIFSLVIGAFMLKMNIPRGRKSIYFIIGIIGTIVVNLIRIFSLSWYALKVTTDPVAWEEYHKIAGEIMFLPWLFVFILIVIVIETRRLKKMESKGNLPPKNNS
jgi:thaumarchaeosortase